MNGAILSSNSNLFLRSVLINKVFGSFMGGAIAFLGNWSRRLEL
jgi:hypothetical protein